MSGWLAWHTATSSWNLGSMLLQLKYITENLNLYTAFLTIGTRALKAVQCTHLFPTRGGGGEVGCWRCGDECIDKSETGWETTDSWVDGCWDTMIECVISQVLVHFQNAVTPGHAFFTDYMWRGSGGQLQQLLKGKKKEWQMSFLQLFASVQKSCESCC